MILISRTPTVLHSSPMDNQGTHSNRDLDKHPTDSQATSNPMGNRNQAISRQLMDSQAINSLMDSLGTNRMPSPLAWAWTPRRQQD